MNASRSVDFDTEAAVEACLSSLPASPGSHTVAFGFDGVIDTVREMVAQRQGPDDYVRIGELSTLTDRIGESAAKETSVTIEWVDKGTRTGGLVAHHTRAFAKLGCNPRMIGFFGDPITSEFESEFAAFPKVTLGTPGRTAAVEFNDGKLLLTETTGHHNLDWATLQRRLGHERLAKHLDEVDLLGVGYWAMIPGLPSIIEGLATELWPTLSSPPAHVLFDPADIRHFPSQRLAAGLDPLCKLNETVPVTVSGNRGEAIAFATLATTGVDHESLAAVATHAREHLGVDRFIAHGASGAATATTETVARVEALQTNDPVLTTSAGDHFNVGVGLGLLEGMNEGALTALGNIVAGSFVRSGNAPSYEDILLYADTYASAVGSGMMM
ncbi:PfkB family carbohydrate kinase [Halocatena halophila]|uniref:PfkB family carbohydrate kinase n=1 Tax=Halocatena halophila TaxID=2814576 RepID=UPI002ED4830A